jgi:hypothetical protein
MDILKGAFNNPIEELLEYEPWEGACDNEADPDAENRYKPVPCDEIPKIDRLSDNLRNTMKSQTSRKSSNVEMKSVRSAGSGSDKNTKDNNPS